MTIVSTGKIFLAEDRGLQQSDNFRSYHTFNSDDYFCAYKQPFGSLYACNDDTIAPGCSHTLSVKDFSYIMLLPVVGNIAYADSSGNHHLLKPGMMHIASAKNTVIRLSNIHEASLVNYLQFGIRSDKSLSEIHQSYSFDIDANRGKLLQLPEAAGESEGYEKLPVMHIGKFKGREEAVHRLRSKEKGVFVFVIEGAFEAQGRLLHSRDGLALWGDCVEAEFEALSNDAIILLIESSL